MSTHLTDDIALAVAFDATGQDSAAAAHVAQCPRCASEVADLQLAAHLVADAKGSASLAQRPPTDLRARVLDSTVDGVPPTPVGAPRWRGLALAAAVALVVGMGLGSLVDLTSPTPAATVAIAELEPLADGAAPADARVVDTGDGLALVVEAPPFDRQAADYFEVWLINEDMQRIVSVGILDPRGEQSFPITQELLDEGYRVVDISRELFDDLPTHSGDSLVRGELSG